MNKLTELEKQMYDVIGAISNGNIPVIFKGAMVTKLILQENHFCEFIRETRDIDASWVGNTPPMEQITVMLNQALSLLDLYAVATREHGEKMSACYDILGATNNELYMTIDIDMRQSTDIRTYQYGSVTFRGVTPNSVISDKISAVSSDKVFRRAKDLLDLYALAHCVTVKTTDIRIIWERESRVIGTFDAFLHRKSDLKHSYEKLRRVDMKPKFDAVYNYLLLFLMPFIKAGRADLTWDKEKSEWFDNNSYAQRHRDTEKTF
ncbi:MAG: nucleotidyl transferase AbiEii/AbiGii toxin family protein [Clostridiales bacterium]|jgi:hypothetical protein|nr:nucleotidyl transferase AbiEii/AbiGii toxin family protein [Clostridiales bacterium]